MTLMEELKLDDSIDSLQEEIVRLEEKRSHAARAVYQLAERIDAICTVIARLDETRKAAKLINELDQL